MKICVVGLGAIGSYLASCLIEGGEEVSALCRGNTLQHITKNGFSVDRAGTTKTYRVNAESDSARIGPQDYIIIAMKSHQSWRAADSLRPMIEDNTRVVTIQNGIPWWYFHNSGSLLNNKTLNSLDPNGRQLSAFGAHRALGCVAYTTVSQPRPGMTRIMNEGHFKFGDPSSAGDERLAPLLSALSAGGLPCSHAEDIRQTVWHKLLGNLCLNPLSVLTDTTMDVLATDPGLRRICLLMMGEAMAVAGALGITFSDSPEARLDHSATLGAHRTSMLQDFDAGRPLEIDGLVAAVSEIGQRLGVETPTIDTILTLVAQRGRMAGVYPAFPAATDLDTAS